MATHKVKIHNEVGSTGPQALNPGVPIYLLYTLGHSTSPIQGA